MPDPARETPPQAAPAAFDPPSPRTFGVPERWILDAVDAWHEVPRNHLGLAALDEEMAFVLSRVAPLIAEHIAQSLVPVWEWTREVAAAHGTTYGVDAVGRCMRIAREAFPKGDDHDA